MSAYALVLGENYMAYMLGAVVAGVVSALLFTDGSLSATSSLGALQVHAWKAAGVAAFLFVMWREADDLFDGLVKASFPIGVYKIAQIFVSLLIVWRSKQTAELQRDGGKLNG